MVKKSNALMLLQWIQISPLTITKETVYNIMVSQKYWRMYVVWVPEKRKMLMFMH